MRNWPVPSVTAVRTFSISAGLAASTETPGSTAPELSRTVPAITACARAVVGTSTIDATTARIFTAARIFHLTFSKRRYAGPAKAGHYVLAFSRPPFLPRELGADPRHPRGQDGDRLQPRSAGHERVVVGQHGAGIQRVI